MLKKSMTIFISVFIFHIYARMDKHADTFRSSNWFFGTSAQKMDIIELGAYHSQGNTFERIEYHFAFFCVYQIFSQVRLCNTKTKPGEVSPSFQFPSIAQLI